MHSTLKSILGNIMLSALNYMILRFDKLFPLNVTYLMDLCLPSVKYNLIWCTTLLDFSPICWHCFGPRVGNIIKTFIIERYFSINVSFESFIFHYLLKRVYLFREVIQIGHIPAISVCENTPHVYVNCHFKWVWMHWFITQTIYMGPLPLISSFTHCN